MSESLEVNILSINGKGNSESSGRILLKGATPFNSRLYLFVTFSMELLSISSFNFFANSNAFWNRL